MMDSTPSLDQTTLLQLSGEPWLQRHERPRSNIRRIRQACTNCRHRKTKCSGERPTCINCRREDRVCQYKPFSATMMASNRGQARTVLGVPQSKAGTVNPELLKRINLIESQLARLSGQGQGAANLSQNEHNAQHSSMDPELQESPPSDSAPSRSRFSPSRPHNFDSETTTTSRFMTLPPHSVMQYLVDVYFLHSHNQPYSYFHEESFRERLSYGLLPKCLVFAVLASAIRFSNNEFFKGAVYEATESYAREAWLSVLNDHLTVENCPNLHVAQTTNMLAIIDFTAGRTSSGWLKIGLAVRIAQDLQLMMEPKSTLPLAEQEERRRAFWSIYLLDKLVSCGQRRPTAISDNDCHVNLPCDHQAFRDGSVGNTTTLNKVLNWNVESRDTAGTFALTVIASSTLGRCAHYSLHEYETDDVCPWDAKSKYTSMNSRLLLVEHHLQSESAPVSEIVQRYKRPDGSVDHQDVSHIIFARTLFHLSYCLLNHPFLLQVRLRKLNCKIPSTFWEVSQQTSRDHALKLVQLLDTAAAAGCHVQSSFYVYSISVAGSILFMTIHAQQEPGPELVEGGQQALNILARMGQAWAHASKMHIQLLLFDAQCHALVKVLEPQVGGEIDRSLDASLWSMVNYDTMCSSSPSAETLSGSFMPDNTSSLGSIDFGLDWGSNPDFLLALAPESNRESP